MRRPDASMSLLTDIQADALEPGYRQQSERRPSRGRLLIAVALVSALVTVAALQTTRGAGDAAAQRTELLDRVAAARARQDELTTLSAELGAEVRELSERALGDPVERQRLADAELSAGSLPVSGPASWSPSTTPPTPPRRKGWCWTATSADWSTVCGKPGPRLFPSTAAG